MKRFRVARLSRSRTVPRSTRVGRAGESAPFFLESFGLAEKIHSEPPKIRALAFARETRALGWRCNTKREIERIVQDFLFPSR
jgi:hypothetical protein